ncbi:hypothetical protein THRCLA_22861 [Thraustotheca clavata]|uniref:FYVE-type domain-containing protein n=1 Tax=Thraustotheca clavata TaxID=74557 RepID=A0A1V9YRQ9_9STRA|nr:hypothetical protein THRCLA_22861 [Thraustotheca clavata]
MTLPLRPNYFKCPPLSGDEKDYLLTQAHRICQETALNALTIVKNPTTKVVVNQCTKRRAQLHYGTDIIDSNMYGITGKTQIKTSYEELIEFFHLTSQKKVRTFGNVVGQAILDRVTLYNLTDQTDDPSSAFIYAGVQWSVIECNVIHPSLTLKRDTCFLEVLNYITVSDPDTGEVRRGFIRAVHSLALDCCPSLRSTHNIVRSALVRSGHLFLETEQPGLFDYYYAYVVADPGKTPKFFNIKVFQRIVGQMLNLEHHIALKRLPKLLQTALNFPNRPYRSTKCIHYCEACDAKFKMLHSKHHCFFCRQIVCTSCIQTYKVPVAGRERTKVEVCTECFCGNKPKRGIL